MAEALSKKSESILNQPKTFSSLIPILRSQCSYWRQALSNGNLRFSFWDKNFFHRIDSELILNPKKSIFGGKIQITFFWSTFSWRAFWTFLVKARRFFCSSLKAIVHKNFFSWITCLILNWFQIDSDLT